MPLRALASTPHLMREDQGELDLVARDFGVAPSESGDGGASEGLSSDWNEQGFEGVGGEVDGVREKGERLEVRGESKSQQAILPKASALACSPQVIAFTGLPLDGLLFGGRATLKRHIDPILAPSNIPQQDFLPCPIKSW